MGALRRGATRSPCRKSRSAPPRRHVRTRRTPPSLHPCCPWSPPLLGATKLGSRSEFRLERIAVIRSSAEGLGRHTGSPAEGADEVGEIRKADFEGYVGHRAIALGQESRRAPQPALDEVLVRSHPEDGTEEPQEVKGGE